MFDINKLKLSSLDIKNLELIELYLVKKFNDNDKISLQIIGNNIIIKRANKKKVSYYKRIIRNLIKYKKITGGEKYEG